jgi:hypothetical protein
MFNGPRYTDTELMARLKFIVGLSLAFTLTGIVFVVLYSLIFVTQPMEQSPNDAKFFELITPIATFLTGILSGIMLGKQEKPDEKPAEPDTVYVPTEPPPEVPAAAPAVAETPAVETASPQDPFNADPNQQK